MKLLFVMSTQHRVHYWSKSQEQGTIEFSVPKGTSLLFLQLQEASWKRGCKECGSWGIGRSSVGYFSLDMAWVFHPQTHSDSRCLHKACTRLGHQHSIMDQGWTDKDPPFKRRHKQLKFQEAGDSWSSLV